MDIYLVGWMIDSSHFGAVYVVQVWAATLSWTVSW